MSFDDIDPHEFVKHHGIIRRSLKKALPRDKEYYNCKTCDNTVTKQCNGCKSGVFYCSSVCQKKDWRNHKPNCGRRYKCVEVPDKGMGNVATRLITKGEIVCVERPVLLMSQCDDTNTISVPDLWKLYTTKFKQLSEDQQKAVTNLSFKSIDRENSPNDKEFAKFLGILKENLKNLSVFDVGKNGLFLDCSRFNHSCIPNSEVYYSEPYLRVLAVKDIKEGEEICFTYFGDTIFGIKDLSDDAPPTIQAMKEDFKSHKAVPKFKCMCWLCTTNDKRKLQEINEFRTKFWKLEKKFYQTKPPSQEYLQICRELLEHINSGDTLHLSWTDFYARKGSSAAILAKNTEQLKFFMEEYHKAVVIRRGEDCLSARVAKDYIKLANTGLLDSLGMPEVEDASFYKDVLKEMHHY